MPAKNICTECSLTELRQMVTEVEQNDQAAIQLLTQPRTFFIERGYFVPLSARAYMVPTEELQARLQTKDDVNKFIEKERDARTKIKIHVTTGVAKCVKIEFE
ncbi:MAG: hypothetical protein HY666_00105 [Chloroflexi bacterium]|nr:hypothetical protein [Chloroflexota bacterium]